MYEDLKTAKRNKYLNFFRLESVQRRRILSSALAMAVVLIGGYLLARTNASGFFVGVDPENGSLSGNAQTINDASASGGKAVLFAAPAPSPTPTPPPTPPPPPPVGGQSCPAYPAFPDASCTGCKLFGCPGVLSGVTPLANVQADSNGDINLNTPNAVYDGKHFLGCVHINATGVTIRNSLVSTKGCTYQIETYSTGVHIEDTTVSCASSSGFTGITDTNFTALRIDVSSCENGFFLDNNVTIQDSYWHDPIPYSNPPDPHIDGVQIGGTGANITLTHNAFLSNIDSSSAVTNPNTSSNVLIQNNLFQGGTYSLYCSANSATNFRVLNNRFRSPWQFGPWQDCEKYTVSGNVYDNGTQAGQLLPGQ